MSIKIRPSVLVLSTGLVVALIFAVVENQYEMVSVLSCALVGSLTKLVESEESSTNGGSK